MVGGISSKELGGFKTRIEPRQKTSRVGAPTLGKGR